MEMQVFQRDSTEHCWVNTFIGKTAHITFPEVSPASGDHTFLVGKALRIDQFGHRYYLVVEQYGKEIHINIDHILMIEEK